MNILQYFVTTAWLTTTYLCVCQSSRAELQEDKKYSQDKSHSANDLRQTSLPNATMQSYSHHKHHHHSRHNHNQANSNQSFSHRSNSLFTNRVDHEHNFERYLPLHTVGNPSTSPQIAAKTTKDDPGISDQGSEDRKSERTIKGKWTKEQDKYSHEDVDAILPALVRYSKDPSLWRFVHRVVAELDYSIQASNNTLPSASRRSHNTTGNRIATWRPTRNQNGRERNRSHGNIGEYLGGGKEGIQDANTIAGSVMERADISTDETIINRGSKIPSHLYDPNRREFDIQSSSEPVLNSDINPNGGSPSKISVGRATHPPQFIFHRVYVDHRPVIAVRAVSGDKTKAAESSNKENDQGELQETMDITDYQLSNDASVELPDKLDELFIQEDHSRELSHGNEDDLYPGNGPMFDLQDGNYSFENHFLEDEWLKNPPSEPSQKDNGWREVTPWHRQQKHFLQRLRQLHSLKSQLKFLRRWQERMLRKRHQWTSYYEPPSPT